MVVKKAPLKSRRERGSVVIEMAFALPVLLMMVAGTVDIGLLFWEKEVLTNASREGARAGARAQINGRPEQTTVEAVRTIVQNYINNYNLRDAAGAPINLVTNSNFFYQWDFAHNPPILWVELRNIPVRMMLLPNIEQLVDGIIANIVFLNAKTTMAPQWDAANPPSS